MRVQSKRRMFVAARRKRKEEFLDWYLTSEDLVFSINLSGNSSYTFLEVVILGSLPGNRKLAKPLRIHIRWDGEPLDGEWLVSEPLFSMHSAAPTLAEAMIGFRRIFNGYLDGLSEHEDRPMAQHLHNQLAYLREMIEETTS